METLLLVKGRFLAALDGKRLSSQRPFKVDRECKFFTIFKFSLFSSRDSLSIFILVMGGFCMWCQRRYRAVRIIQGFVLKSVLVKVRILSRPPRCRVIKLGVLN